MPTYDYECVKCKHELEAFHAMSAAPLKKCPACGKQALRRKIGPGAGLLFKGSGFYQTDYRSESYQKSAKTEAAPAKPAEAAKPAESKPKEKAASASPAKA
jgi:putative FmdB family regulatory protein